MFKYLIGILAIFSTFFGAEKVWAENDPTKPFSGGKTIFGQTVKSKPLVLQSIIHGHNTHTVIINDQLMKVGDTIGEYRLIAVNDKSVLLRSAEESKKLYIFSELSAK